MKTQTIEIDVKNPETCTVYPDLFLDGVKHVEVILPFTEITKLKRGNANVRPPNQKKKPFRAMQETVEFAPRTFHLKNRGITYFCLDAKYDTKHHTLLITVPEKSSANGIKWGIADGGHTFEVVNQTVSDEQNKAYDQIVKWVMPNTRVHFIINNDAENTEPIVEALNTSLQVQGYTLDEYQGKFEPLKKDLDNNGFDVNLIAFRENEEDKEWNVIEVVQRLACFLKDRWVTTQPMGMYKSKGKALRLYTNEETRPEFRMLKNVMKDVLTLPEYIQSEFSIGEIIPPKSLGKLKCVKPLKETYTRPGTEYKTEHKIDMAALLPMAAAFRILLEEYDDSDGYEWKAKLDYKGVFRHCAVELYEHLRSRVGMVPMSNMLASDVDYWAGCVQIVQRAKEELTDTSGRVVKRKHGSKVLEDITPEENDDDVDNGRGEESQLEASEEPEDDGERTTARVK